MDPIDLVCDYLIEDKGATRVLITSIAEDDIREIIRSPTALVGSDGNCVADYGIVSQGMPHPRFYGTFPRVLGHYVHDEHLLPLEMAVRKMTGATAAALQLRDRGLLGRLARRHRNLRPGRFQGPRDLCAAPPIPERRAHDGIGQRRGRRRQRAPHRRLAGNRPAPRARRFCRITVNPDHARTQPSIVLALCPLRSTGLAHRIFAKPSLCSTQVPPWCRNQDFSYGSLGRTILVRVCPRGYLRLARVRCHRTMGRIFPAARIGGRRTVRC